MHQEKDTKTSDRNTKSGHEPKKGLGAKTDWLAVRQSQCHSQLTLYTQPLKMELIQGSETSANYNLTPGKYPEESIRCSNHGESLKSRIRHLYGEDIALLIRRLEKLRIKKTTLLSSLTFLLRCRDHNIIPRFLQIHHHIRSHAANRIYQRTSFALLRERIQQNRRELDSTSRALLDTHLRLANTLTTSHWLLIDQLTFNKATYIGDDRKARNSHGSVRINILLRKHLRTQ